MRDALITSSNKHSDYTTHCIFSAEDTPFLTAIRPSVLEQTAAFSSSGTYLDEDGTTCGTQQQT